MPLFKITEEKFEPLEETTFEAERLLERQDIQRRLLAEPSILGPDLLILDEEFGDWTESNRRIDILALDSQGRLVVVEIKRSDSDSLMDLQAIRYAAMVSGMDFQQATEAHRRYLEDRKMDGTEAASRIRQHISADDAEVDIDSSKPRIFLVSASFSKELTTSVMWLKSFGMDVTCVKLQPYRSADGLFMESSIVIPMPEVDDYLVRLRNRYEEQRQPQVGGARVHTFAGGEQFRAAIDRADASQQKRLTTLYEMALSLQAEGLAELSTRVGSYNTVLRVRFPGSDQGLINVFKNESGWGYLKFGCRSFDRRAPEAKARLEDIIGSGIIGGRGTLWELPEGFVEEVANAYREASGQSVTVPATGSTPESGPSEDAGNSEPG